MKPLSDRRVLVVDDVRANVQLLTRVLQGEYQVSVAFDGESALRSIAESPPDLVLLDIMMPGLDGYEVLRRLRADPGTHEIPVMFLSSLEDVGNKAKGFELGANDYLSKPFELLEVRARVRSLLRARAWSEAVREAMDRDLAIARSIQMGILPRDLSPVTRDTGLDVAARLEPAQQVGGDLYLALRTAPDEVFVAVGDVSGKGIPASIFMAVTVTLLRTLARQGHSPHEVLARVNDELVEQNAGDLFVTLVCARIALSSGRVEIASAGHPPPLLVAPGASPLQPYTTAGLVAGFRGGESYESDAGTLAPGEMLVFFSDGIPEAWSAAGEAFGQERLTDLLATRAGDRARETVDAVVDAVHAHAAGTSPSDDITVLALRRRPLAT
ncbi:MAG TPA: fused response regulator/phosphatase [Thermoanaerobaculia bacterium]|nr:fused response regulator/phosphatase [Thermoanaerobaculia bacterium]